MPPSIVVKNDTFVLITSIPPMHRIAAVGNLGTSRIFSKLKLFKWVNNKKLQEKYLNYSNTQQIRRIISFSDENFHKPSPYVRSTYIFPIKKTAVQIGPQFDNDYSNSYNLFKSWKSLLLFRLFEICFFNPAFSKFPLLQIVAS